MPTLAEVFEHLSAGELSQMSLGGWKDGTVPVKDRARVLTHLNAGLQVLYARFWLGSREVILQIYDHIQTYTLDREYAVTNTASTQPYKYIMDSAYEPFMNDVLKIEQVFNEGGELMFMNDPSQPWSIFTPAYNQIQIPFPERHNSMIVHYRIAHPKIVLEPNQDPAEVVINLPPTLLEPLCLYVASRAWGAMSSDQGQESMLYLQKFDAACKAAEMSNIQVDPAVVSTRLDDNGWV